MNARLLVCLKCNSELIIGATSSPELCIFCGADLSQSDAKMINYDFSESFIIPFSSQANAKTLSSCIFEWLIGNANTPDDVLENGTFNALYGLYVPLWNFSGRYDVLWNASSGYYRTEHYTAYETKHENGRNKQVKVTKTRTVTDWKPASGKNKGNFIESGIETEIFEDNLLNFCEGAILKRDSIVQFSAIHIDGYRLKSFSGDDPDYTFEKRVKRKINSTIDKKVNECIPGDTSKDVSWDADISIADQSKIYYPYWVAQFEYKNNGYIALVDGYVINRIGGNYPMENAVKRKKAFKYSFIPFRLAIAFTLASLVAMYLTTNDINVDSIKTILAISIPAIVASYIYGKLKNKKIRKLQNEYRQLTLLKAVKEKSFNFGV